MVFTTRSSGGSVVDSAGRMGAPDIGGGMPLQQRSNANAELCRLIRASFGQILRVARPLDGRGTGTGRRADTTRVPADDLISPPERRTLRPTLCERGKGQREVLADGSGRNRSGREGRPR